MEIIFIIINLLIIIKMSDGISIGNVLTFIIICCVFIISALAYSNLSRDLDVQDITNSDKKVYYNQAKKLCLAILLLSGVALLIQSYMLLFVKNPEKSKISEDEFIQFSGQEKCGIDTCNDGIDGISVK